ncbi:fimbrial protein [Pantoea sp. GM01]|uniref:fimbrial protein n=1 Tax=Pantoea sp. GM01 TaxID=1144320 RepID=UPI0009DAEB63|nr:fimbrial protein [Pantoea sp. GM01]
MAALSVVNVIKEEKMKSLLHCLLLLSGLSMFGSSWAACTSAPATLNVAMSSPTAVSSLTPIGTVISTGSVNYRVTCSGVGANTAMLRSGLNTDYGASPVPGVRNTSLAGIGIRWTNTSNGTPFVWTNYSMSDGSIYRGLNITGAREMSDLFELVKTGPVTSGTTTTWVLNYNWRTGTAGAQTRLLTVNLPAMTIPVATCSLTQTVIPVNLGNKIPLKTFTGPGSVSSPEGFNIPLICDPQVPVTVQFTGTPAAGLPTVLALSADSVATGLGVQLAYHDVPVTLNSALAVGDSGAAGGVYDIPFTAHFYQTAATVTPGLARAVATFTLTYN